MIKRVALIVLTLISLLGVLFRMGFVPPFLGASDKYVQINETLTSLAMSFLAAMIFYVLTVVIPEYNDKRKARKGLVSSFEKVYEEMSYVIGALMMMANITKPEKDIKEDDWNSFDNANFLMLDKWYVRRFGIHNGKEDNGFIRTWIHYDEDLLKRIKSLKKQIEKINMSPLVRGLSIETVDLFRSVYNSPIIFSLDLNIRSRQLFKPMVKRGVDYSGFVNFPHEMAVFCDNHNRVGKLCKNTRACRYEKMTEEEAELFEKERNTLLASIPDIKQFEHTDDFQEIIFNGIRLY